MRLLKLDIRNIASIESATIDWRMPAFENESIFLIYGETGSGKSTLLDAICLALYKKTPRLETASHNVYVDEAFTKRGGGEVLSNTSDVEQYIRRGTQPGEPCYSELLFEANDGENYTARLEFLRTTTGNLKETVWTLTYPDGRVLRGKGAGSAGVGDKVVSPEINRLVGLDYKQFCRTTMLAQGEFTKFLKASDKDRCEILEKITDTGRFKRIGEELAARLGREQRILDEIRAERDALPLKDPAELTRIRVRLRADRVEATYLSLHAQYLRAQLDWLGREAELTHRQQEADKALAAARQVIAGEVYRNRQLGISQWRATERERQAVVKMDAILSRHPGLEQVIAEEREKQVAREARLKQLEQDVLQSRAAIEKIDLSDLTLRKSACDNRLKLIETLLLAWNAVAEQRERVEKQKVLVAQQQKQEAEAVENRQKAEKARQEAEQSKLQTTRRYNDMAERLGHATAILSHLHEGDSCPVCGNIYHVLEREDLLAPLREEKEAADTLCEKRARAYEEAVSQENAARTTCNLAENTLTTALSNLRTAQSSLAAAAAPLQIPAESDTLPADAGKMKGEVEAENRELSRKIAEATPLQNRYTQVQNSYNTELREDSKARQALQVLEQEMTELQTCRDILRQATLPEERIRQLARVDLAYVDQMDRQQMLANNQLTEAEAARSGIEKERREHHARSQAWGAADTAALESAQRRAEAGLEEVNRRIGANHQLLATNREYMAKAETLSQQAVLQQQVVSQWDVVCRDFSGKSKDRFSRIAQGYILRELLDYANDYLARFTTRYLLSIQPDSTAILVKDLHCGGIARPVDMLSGGESFMISLSLALGLIRLGSSSFHVDTLFIDEGFGTLDANSLETVIMTLEKLQQLSGRKVGIISHVKELRQRVGLRIAVTRKSGSRGVSEIAIEQ